MKLRDLLMEGSQESAARLTIAAAMVREYFKKKNFSDETMLGMAISLAQKATKGQEKGMPSDETIQDLINKTGKKLKGYEGNWFFDGGPKSGDFVKFKEAYLALAMKNQANELSAPLSTLGYTNKTADEINLSAP